MLLLGLVVFLSGVILTLAAVRMLFKRRFLLAGVNGTTGLSLLSLAVMLILVLLNLHTYNRLTSELPLASIEIGKETSQGLPLNLRTANHKEVYFIHAEEWQLDARFLKLKSWAYLLGSHPAVRLERLSGRNVGGNHDLAVPGLHVPASNETFRLVAQNHLVDGLGAKIGDWIGIVDTYYGSSVYMPAVEGANYQVTAAVSGLLVRPANNKASQAVRQWMVE